MVLRLSRADLGIALPPSFRYPQRKNEVQRLLDDALAKLDEKHRIVFLLRDVEGLSVKEAAEALGLSEANTKVRLLRARLQLREQLTRTLGDPDRSVVRTHQDH